MNTESSSLYDAIDLGNLFEAWHPDIRRFTQNLNQDCVLNIIKSTSVSTFDPFRYDQVLNLTNTRQCRILLNRILKETNTNNFIDILEERDKLFPRDIPRGYSLKQILESVKKDYYHPILFLELNKKYYIIDGRTRFYCCIFSNLPAKVRIIFGDEIERICAVIKSQA